MAPFSMFLALQPQLREAWQLSKTATGWISNAYFTGYMAAVPVLVSLTDRYDARTIWLGSTAIAVGAALGFGLIAGGVWTALLFQFLAGASLAGTYMPGLKLIADRIAGALHPRFVAFYTTSFTIGASVSFFSLVGVPASLAGAELTTRVDRRRLVTCRRSARPARRRVGRELDDCVRADGCSERGQRAAAGART